MKQSMLLGSTTSLSRTGRLSRRTVLGAALGLAAWLALPAGWAQAPRVTSVTPANGATGVPVTSSLVFVFDQNMDTDVDAIPSMPPFLTGNLEVNPSVFVDSAWSADGRTLTCTPSSDWPAQTTITWRLNPPGTILPFTSSSGTPVATTSGTFTTGESGGGGGDGGPTLISVTPADGATGVSVTTTVVFVFDQAMQKNPLLGGFPPAVPGAVAWGGTGVTASKFSYAWSEDGRTLTCTYAGGLPGETVVTWTLNPAGSVIQLESDAGEPLETGRYSGRFTTGQGSGGGEDCYPEGYPDTWGTYTLSKMAMYQQTSTADPVPDGESPFMFGVFLKSPQAGPALTAGSVTLPDNSTKTLEAIFGFLSFNDTPATEAALDAAYPPGNYTLRFTQTGQPERVISMTMPAATLPVPKIANFNEAQAVNAAQDFTLRWNAFTGAGAQDYISVTVTDANGNLLFQAPNPCVPRELPVTATSTVIPANALQTDKTYRGTLLFGRMFYSSTNAVPEMGGFGGRARSTEFTVKTGTGGAAGQARFTGYRLLPNGNPQMDLTGTPGASYTIQRTGNVGSANWTSAGTATMNASGLAVFEDTQAGKVFPLFYRAVGN